MIKTETLSPPAVEVLGQLFVSGPTWDGNLVSKQGRQQLIEVGLAERYDGFNFLTRDGAIAAIEWDTRQRPDRRWNRKQNGA